VKPELKRKAQELVKRTPLFRSVSQLMELSLMYYLDHFEKAHGHLDSHGFPDTSSQKPSEERRRAAHP